MKVSRLDVIDQNRSLVFGFVPNIQSGDALQLIGDRAHDKVVVTPDNLKTEEVTVTFRLDAVMAVSDGTDLEDLVNLLHASVNGSIGALGTGLAGGLKAGDGIAGATVQTLKQIMTTPGAQNNITILVRVTDIDVSNPPVRISVSSSVAGWTRTTDTDSDEIANLTFKSKLLAKSGNTVETTNVGTSSQIELNKGSSDVVVDVSSSEVQAVLEIGWNLLTDGAFTHDTISLIQIATASMVIKYV